jgi:Golgi apyrase
MDQEDAAWYVACSRQRCFRRLIAIITGVSTFGEKPETIGEDHLQPLIDHALKHVPKSEVENTPFFLLATAGMRLLPDHQRTAVLDSICKYVQSNTQFQVPDCDLHVQVIPGATEGLYGWVAANYLLGGFDFPKDHDHGKGHHTYGFLDMGGASAQIAFAPNATEAEKHAEDLKLLRLRTIDGAPQEHKIFVTTWLGFGANEARRRFVDALKESVGGNAKELPDPCLPVGLKATLAGTPILPGSPEELGHEPHLLGTGKFDECIRQTYPLLEKDKPCDDDPCLLGGTHVPAIDFDVNHFVGVSEYWHTTHSIFEMDHDNKAYDFKTYQNRISAFCSQPWKDIVAGVEKKKWGKKVDEKTAEEVCFKASWLINMLHEGIGVPRVGLEMAKGSSSRNDTTKQLIEGAKSKGFLDPFQAVDKVEGTEVSWTLGKMVLYAASQIPPSNDELPVGFGSNEPGLALPKDFQRPGGSDFKLPNDLTDVGTPDATDSAAVDGAEEADWHDALFRDSPRRIPGFLLFMLILLVLVFLLCGRDRRAALISKARRTLGLGKRSPGAGSSLGKYDRVLHHDPEAAGEFELGASPYDDDGSDSEGSEGATSSRAAISKVPGWATPTMEAAGGGSGGSPGKMGLGVKAWAPQGLMSRTDSRERLSRSGSPRAGFRMGKKDALD